MGVSTLLPDASHESDVGNRFSNENAVYVCRRDVGMFFCCVFFLRNIVRGINSMFPVDPVV